MRIKNVLANIFINLFYYSYVINNFKYVKMEIYHLNRYLQYKFKVGEHVMF